MNLFNQLANLNRPAVNDPKLSDFTKEELEAMYIAINGYLVYYPETNLRPHLEMASVQIVNAGIIVRERERILNT